MEWLYGMVNYSAAIFNLITYLIDRSGEFINETASRDKRTQRG